MMTDPASDIFLPDPLWAPPKKPEARTCLECGSSVQAQWEDPLWCAGKIIFGGDWTFHPSGLCEKCRRAEEDRREAERMSILARKRLEAAGFSKKQMRMTMETFRPHPGVEAAYEAAMGFACGAAENLFFFGASGVGKTHLACAALRLRMENLGCSGRITSEAGFLSRLRRSFGDGRRGEPADPLEDLLSADAVVLDDIGVAGPADWTVRELYLFLDEWENEERSGLILTSNLPLEEISRRTDDRIASRIAGICRIARMEGPDMRAAGK